MVACECTKKPTAAAVRLCTNKTTERRVKAGIKSKKRVQITAKSEKKNGHDKVSAGKAIKEEAHITAERQNQKILKKPDESYQHIQAFSEIGKVSLFKNESYKVSVLIGLIYSRTRPIVYVFNASAGRNLTRADVLDESWLNTIRQHDRPGSEARTTLDRLCPDPSFSIFV